MHGVGLDPDPDYAATIPAQTYMIYQLMFAIITPALITGAFAERMKFSAMCLFLTLWAIVVYSPMAHMVWGKGGFLNASLGGKIPCLDFAGGTVVHVTSGVSALVCALYLGKRVGYPKEPSPPHSVVLSFIGACLLWVGWFGFNAGCARRRQRPRHQRLRQHPFRHRRRRHRLERRRVDPQRQAQRSRRHLRRRRRTRRHHPRFRIRAAHVRPRHRSSSPASFCFLMVTTVKGWFGYDDSLDAFGVHGAGGTVGAILTGVFATSAINPVYGPGKPTGAIEGNWHQVLNQFIGVAIAWVLSIVGTLILLKLVDMVDRPARHPRRRDRRLGHHPARRRRLRLRFLIHHVYSEFSQDSSHQCKRSKLSFNPQSWKQ